MPQVSNPGSENKPMRRNKKTPGLGDLLTDSLSQTTDPAKKKALNDATLNYLDSETASVNRKIQQLRKKSS